jgi:DnaJ-class molecular chaperone
MSDIVIDCEACDGWEVYPKGSNQKCGLCNGMGVLEIPQDSFVEFKEYAVAYKKLIDEGGKPEDFDM